MTAQNCIHVNIISKGLLYCQLSYAHVRHGQFTNAKIYKAVFMNITFSFFNFKAFQNHKYYVRSLFFFFFFFFYKLGFQHSTTILISLFCTVFFILVLYTIYGMMTIKIAMPEHVNTPVRISSVWATVSASVSFEKGIPSVWAPVSFDN